MTLNGVIALILRFFPPNLIALLAICVTFIEDVNMMSVSSLSLPLLAIPFLSV